MRHKNPLLEAQDCPWKEAALDIRMEKLSETIDPNR